MNGLANAQRNYDRQLPAGWGMTRRRRDDDEIREPDWSDDDPTVTRSVKHLGDPDKKPAK